MKKGHIISLLSDMRIGRITNGKNEKMDKDSIAACNHTDDCLADRLQQSSDGAGSERAGRREPKRFDLYLDLALRHHIGTGARVDGMDRVAIPR